MPCDCELLWHVRLKAMVALDGLSGRNATRRGFACVLAVFDRKAFGPAIREWPARRRAGQRMAGMFSALLAAWVCRCPVTDQEA